MRQASKKTSSKPIFGGKRNKKKNRNMIQPATWAVRGKDYFIVQGILFKANEVSELPVQSSVSEHVVISYTQVRVRKARGAMGPGLRPATPSSPWNGEAVHTR